MREPTPHSTPEDRERRIAEALADFVDLEAQGKTVKIDVFCRSRADLHPELAEQLYAMASIAESADTGRPETLSGHKILDEIGSGGMGRVFLAMDEGLGRRIAIKTLAPRFLSDSQLRTRFMQEARSMARLNHSNVVRIYNLGQPDEAPHFVMEYVDGVPLTQAARPLTFRQKAEMMHKVVLAVDFLHQNHVIHRDLKPGNILVAADLEPKLLDFGLALHLGDKERLTRSGIAVGTPRYFSPEQARADAPLDARSDVFSLGTILYELLTGVLPFQGESPHEDIQILCNKDPVLPRRVSAEIPGELQNICMKALEKNPEDRYASAREMAEDLARYLAGEQPLAAPASYSRLMTSKVERHLRELESWKNEGIVSEDEFRTLKNSYDRLIERDDAWIMEARRLTLSQVTLYLGAWISVVGAALLVLFDYADLKGTAKVVVGVVATIPMLLFGIRFWKQGSLRTGIAFLLAFCLMLPVVMMVVMHEYNFASHVPPEMEQREFFKTFFASDTTNNQLWWSLLLSMPLCLWLRRFTHSSVFSLVIVVATTLLSVTWLLQRGLLEWIDDDQMLSRTFTHMIPIVLLFFGLGMIIERLRFPSDSRYFYPVAVGFTWITLTGLAATHEGYLESVTGWWSGFGMEREYLFLANAGIYFVLQRLCDWLPWDQLKSVARAFRWVIPTHVLLAMRSLEDSQSDPTALRILVLAVAFAFVFLSIPRQMKNFFVWGMIFVGVGIVDLQNDLFKDTRGWLLTLLISGMVVMLLATHYAGLRMTVARWIRRRR